LPVTSGIKSGIAV